MANPEHLKILKQGVAVWNRWREDNPEIEADLQHAGLEGADLEGVSLKGVNLGFARLITADLSYAHFSNAHLDYANLVGTILEGARLDGASLIEANVANARFEDASLVGTKLENARFGWTAMVGIDLSQSDGLETVFHVAPSGIATSTLELTAEGLAKDASRQGEIEAFYRGAGVTEHLIEYYRSRIGQPIEFYSCFISYSHKDKLFAHRLYDQLQVRGMRCWLDEHDMKPGDRILDAVGLSGATTKSCSAARSRPLRAGGSRMRSARRWSESAETAATSSSR